MSGVALLPARGGSKRIPRKNVRPFLGEPALARVIRTILNAAVVDRVLVSTDDDEVADIGRASGADVPGRRPPELSDDHATTIAVVRHAIEEWLGALPDETVLWVVYPTALLIGPEDLQAAARRFDASGAPFLVPVLRYPHPIERRVRIHSDGTIRPDEPARIDARTQDLAPAYHDAGQYYIGRIRAWRSSSPLIDPHTVGLEIPPDAAVDVDEPDQWERAERLARLMADEASASE